MKQTKGCAKLAPPKEVLFEGLAYRLKSGVSSTIDFRAGRRAPSPLRPDERLKGEGNVEATMAWSARRAWMIVNSTCKLRRKIQVCNSPVSTEALVRLSGYSRRSQYCADDDDPFADSPISTTQKAKSGLSAANWPRKRDSCNVEPMAALIMAWQVHRLRPG
jgi:hypothetical protein